MPGFESLLPHFLASSSDTLGNFQSNASTFSHVKWKYQQCLSDREGKGIKAFKGLSLLIWHMEEWLLLPSLCLVCCFPEGLSAPTPVLPHPPGKCVTQVLYLSPHISVFTRLCIPPGREEAILHPCI